MTIGNEHDGVLDIAVLTTGGTIEKTYDAHEGRLHNTNSVLDHILAELVLEQISLHRQAVMCKDSLEMTAEDHLLIAESAIEASRVRDGVIVIHGTDRLAQTGEAICKLAGGELASPIVLTGAMRPWIVRDSDAHQNVTEAILAVQLLAPGVYVCMHSRVLRFPGVVKDRKQLRFVRVHELEQETNS